MGEEPSDDAPKHVAIEVKDGLIYVDGALLLDEEVQRSKLLQEMLNSDGMTSVPLSARLFTRWRQYISMIMQKETADAENIFTSDQELIQSPLHDRVAVLEVRYY